MRDRLLALTGTVANMTSRQLSQTIFRKSKSALPIGTDLSIEERYEISEYPDDVRYEPVRTTTDLVQSSIDDTYRQTLQERLSLLNEGSIAFLNRSLQIGDTIPKRVSPTVGEKAGFPRLWTLKLLSLEPVMWLAFGTVPDVSRYIKKILNWLNEWDRTQYTTISGSGDRQLYWASYTVSRRIWNLALLGSLIEGNASTDNRIGGRLLRNLRFLSDHIEYDIGGNHVIENAYALILGGSILRDDAYISEGIDILITELESQLLDDGIHYERSPMYHAILLFRGVWTLGILERSGYVIPKSVKKLLRSMYTALVHLAPGNANFPLLNDSVYNECPSRVACLNVSECLLGFERPDDPPQSTDGSGYYIVLSDKITAIVDGGDPGPRHLPGHSHNDVGNVVAWFGDEPVLTDTGTFDYQKGKRRQFARSVAAHNTIQADDSNQTVTHGRFKMGPRPNIDANSKSDGTVQVSFRSPPFAKNYIHKRQVEPISSGLRIIDRLHGDAATYTARFHIPPGVHIEKTGTQAAVVLPSREVLKLTMIGTDDLRVTEAEFYPEYGVAIKRPCLEGTVRNQKNKTIQIDTLLTQTDDDRTA